MKLASTGIREASVLGHQLLGMVSMRKLLLMVIKLSPNSVWLLFSHPHDLDLLPEIGLQLMEIL